MSETYDTTYHEAVSTEAVQALGDRALQLATHEVEPQERLKIGVLKEVASSSSAVPVDSLSLDTDEIALQRIVKQYGSKKNKKLHKALHEALTYIAEHAEAEGSDRVQGLSGGEPTCNGQQVSLWRFKPRDAQGYNAPTILNDIRIVYAVVENESGEPTIGILDILSRDEFGKKYK